MKRLYLTLFLAILAVTSQAQSTECGTEATAEHFEELINKAELVNSRDLSVYRKSTRQVPVKIHVVRKSDQSTTISRDMIIREIDKLNDLFSGAKLEFLISSDFNYIDSDEWYAFQQEDETDLAATRDEANVLNLYFVGSITDKQGSNICGYTYFPKSGKDRMVIANGCLNNSTTLAHEMGHYFALLHTHGMSGNALESVDGSNCTNAGDLLCDTPADPNLKGVVDDECRYTGDEKDPNGVTYNPSTKNIMSYSPSYCRAEFTTKQLELISLVAEENKGYLTAGAGYEPVADIVASSPNTNGTKELNVKLYPNPSANQIGVEILDGYDGEFQIRVFNVTGQVVQQTPVSTYNSGNIVQLDLTDMGNGIYFVSVIAERQRTTEKISLM